jgi:hypothetical protein
LVRKYGKKKKDSIVFPFVYLACKGRGERAEGRRKANVKKKKRWPARLYYLSALVDNISEIDL